MKAFSAERLGRDIMKEKLRLYHTNDLHSHFENWPKIVDYIEQKRKEHQSDGEETLVLILAIILIVFNS